MCVQCESNIWGCGGSCCRSFGPCAWHRDAHIVRWSMQARVSLHSCGGVSRRWRGFSTWPCVFSCSCWLSILFFCEWWFCVRLGLLWSGWSECHCLWVCPCCWAWVRCFPHWPFGPAASVFVMQKSFVYTVSYTSKRWTVGALEAARPLYSVWNGGPGGNVCWSLA